VGLGSPNWDVSIFKNIPMGERFALQFRSEAYSSRPREFGLPNTQIGSAAAGVTTTRRIRPETFSLRRR
jgi:hypothetical protein